MEEDGPPPSGGREGIMLLLLEYLSGFSFDIQFVSYAEDVVGQPV